MSAFQWQPSQGHFTGALNGLRVDCDPMTGLMIREEELGIAFGPVLGLEIVDANDLGKKPLAEPGFVPEVVCRQDTLLVKYLPTPNRPVECHAHWQVRSARQIDLEISALTPGLWHGLYLQTLTQLPFGQIEVVDTSSFPLAMGRFEQSPWTYIEMLHPHDAAGLEFSHGLLRQQLFGHDLEKGVILRGRLRALLIPRENDLQVALKAFEQFVQEEPNLSE